MRHCVANHCHIQGDLMDAVKSRDAETEIRIIKNQIRKAYKEYETSTIYRISRHKHDHDFWDYVATSLKQEGYTVSAEIEFFSGDIATLLIHWKGARKSAKKN